MEGALWDLCKVWGLPPSSHPHCRATTPLRIPQGTRIALLLAPICSPIACPIPCPGAGNGSVPFAEDGTSSAGAAGPLPWQWQPRAPAGYCFLPASISGMCSAYQVLWLCSVPPGLGTALQHTGRRLGSLPRSHGWRTPALHIHCSSSSGSLCAIPPGSYFLHVFAIRKSRPCG